MFPILNLWTAHERGEPDVIQPLGPPPHLQGRDWKFVCSGDDESCGYVWKATADAVWYKGAWSGPAQACLNCKRWVTGRPI